MAEIKSSLGNKQVQGSPMREFSVADESGYASPQVRPSRPQTAPVFDEAALQEFNNRLAPQPVPLQTREFSEVEKQIMDAKRAKREGKERLSEGARRRIEMLIGMTRLTKDIDIDGRIYRIRTLTSKELREVLMSASAFDGNIQFIFESRKQVLGRSLTVVAGVEIEQFLGSTDLQDRLDFIEEMDHSLLIRLYNEYNELAAESQNKYSPKTEADVKEVLEDLKK